MLENLAFLSPNAIIVLYWQCYIDSLCPFQFGARCKIKNMLQHIHKIKNSCRKVMLARFDALYNAEEECTLEGFQRNNLVSPHKQVVKRKVWQKLSSVYIKSAFSGVSISPRNAVQFTLNGDILISLRK